MTLFELANDYKDQRFRIGRSKIIWDACSIYSAYKVKISRVCKADEKGGKPFLMGLRYKIRWADANSIVHIVTEE